jgi:hypothetical protein
MVRVISVARRDAKLQLFTTFRLSAALAPIAKRLEIGVASVYRVLAVSRVIRG